MIFQHKDEKCVEVNGNTSCKFFLWLFFCVEHAKRETQIINSKGVYNTNTKQLMDDSNGSVNEMNQRNSTVKRAFSASGQSGHDSGGTGGIGNVITRYNSLVDLAMEQTIDIMWIDEFLRNPYFKQSIKGVSVHVNETHAKYSTQIIDNWSIIHNNWIVLISGITLWLIYSIPIIICVIFLDIKFYTIIIVPSMSSIIFDATFVVWNLFFNIKNLLSNDRWHINDELHASKYLLFVIGSHVLNVLYLLSKSKQEHIEWLFNRNWNYIGIFIIWSQIGIAFTLIITFYISVYGNIKTPYQVKLRQTIAKRAQTNSMNNNTINNSIINSINSFNSINNNNNINGSMNNSNNNNGNNDDFNFASAATPTHVHNPVGPQIYPNGLNLASIVKNTKNNTKIEKTSTLTSSTTVSRKIYPPSNPSTPQRSADGNHDENKSEDKAGNGDEMIGLHVDCQTMNNILIYVFKMLKLIKKQLYLLLLLLMAIPRMCMPNGQNAQESCVRSNLDSMSINNIAANSISLRRNSKKSSNENSSHSSNNSNTDSKKSLKGSILDIFNNDCNVGSTITTFNLFMEHLNKEFAIENGLFIIFLLQLQRFLIRNGYVLNHYQTVVQIHQILLELEQLTTIGSVGNDNHDHNNIDENEANDMTTPRLDGTLSSPFVTPDHNAQNMLLVESYAITTYIILLSM